MSFKDWKFKYKVFYLFIIAICISIPVFDYLTNHEHLVLLISGQMVAIVYLNLKLSRKI